MVSNEIDLTKSDNMSSRCGKKLSNKILPENIFGICILFKDILNYVTRYFSEKFLEI